MADTPEDASKKSNTIKLDGDHVVSMLKGAGLDPHKLDVRKALPGANVDYHELESRLRGTHTAADAAPKKGGGWHVSVVVSRD